MTLPLRLFALLTAGYLGHSQAAPYLPTSADSVVAQLPYRVADPVDRDLLALRRLQANPPSDWPSAARLAQRYLDRARKNGDPRYLSYAEVVLAPWLQRPTPPTAAWLLRASLRQSRHDFAGALDDLRRVLQQEPRNAQAWLTRATLLQVQADYRGARQSCERLAGLGQALSMTVCLAQVDSLEGRAVAAYRSLQPLLQSVPEHDPQRPWLESVAGEIAERAGQMAQAENHYRRALALDRDDSYTLAALADLLLDQRRPAEVVALLSAATTADALLLRLVLAKARLQQPDYPRLRDELAARYAANQQRGDATHLREEARFALDILQQPAQALRLAERNWQMQREPWDARILAAARAAVAK